MSNIRLATDDDAARIQRIYAPFCLPGSAVSFEIEAPSVPDIEERIRATLENYPWLVCERQGTVTGYAYATQHKQRAAYRWSVDTSVYIDQHEQGRGIGKALYTALFAILRLQGFVNAYAGVTLPNPASVGLHKSMGFTEVGVYRQVGYKGGCWHDVAWFELELLPRGLDQPPPTPLGFVAASKDFSAAISSGLQLLEKPPGS